MPKRVDLDAADSTNGVRYFLSSTETQVLFLGLFALALVANQQEVFQWKFPGWVESNWTIAELEDRSDAVLSEHTQQVIEEYYPGATAVRPGAGER